jgi:ribonuclease PH
MLPRATKTRTSRDASQIGGRTQEIQRLIGRSVRAMIDDFAWGEYTLKIDCDVMQADGGTRRRRSRASVAVYDAFAWMVEMGKLKRSPRKRRVAGVSVGVVKGEPRLDLEYIEDVVADVDMNVVMSSEGGFVEVQGTGENATFSRDELNVLLDLATKGLLELDALQRSALGI